jgi:hypothetical protein
MKSVLIAGAVSIAIACPAQASTGTMSQSVFNGIDITIPDSDTRAQVENACGCSGDQVWSGTRNGNAAIQVRYDTPNANTWDYVNYVLRDADGKWHAYSKLQGSGVGKHRHHH